MFFHPRFRVQCCYARDFHVVFIATLLSVPRVLLLVPTCLGSDFTLLSSYTLLSFLTGFFARDDLFIMLGAYKAIEYISQNRWRCILSQRIDWSVGHAVEFEFCPAPNATRP